jgi:hypothetical protein
MLANMLAAVAKPRCCMQHVRTCNRASLLLPASSFMRQDVTVSAAGSSACAFTEWTDQPAAMTVLLPFCCIYMQHAMCYPPAMGQPLQLARHQ